ncbi:zinc finger protein 420-like [Phlebotomus argentipes]|uniref:zinc finger protein 420-like n=1 Tax=Phlebotomus argentipes TaxID=94469 RepID=UPI0028933AF3|nr:zinc finger protein 420-like [Phlebotomus argentipes]
MEDWAICRLCLQSSDALKPLPDVTYNMIPFFNIYFELVGITFTEYPTYPSRICQSCEGEMKQAYKFREKCLATEEKLKDLMMDEEAKEAPIEFITTQQADESIEFKEKLFEEEEKLDESTMDSLCESVDTKMTASDEMKSIELPESPIEATDELPAIPKRIVHKFSRRQLKEMESKNIQCRRCNGKFKGIELFKKHGCNATSERKQTEIKPKKVHTCPECGRSYSSRQCYNAHMDKVHTNNKRYECYDCGKKFFSWLQRRTHSYKVHLKKFHCECPHCGKGFYTQHSLTKHISGDHLNLKTYQCAVCGKTYKRADQLRDHERIHSGKKTCEICGKLLNSTASLKQHLRTHTNERNYICPVCSKGFTCNFSMKTHVRKLHPSDVHLLPPDGTIVNQKYLKKLRENEEAIG